MVSLCSWRIDDNDSCKSEASMDSELVVSAVCSQSDGALTELPRASIYSYSVNENLHSASFNLRSHLHLTKARKRNVCCYNTS